VSIVSSKEGVKARKRKHCTLCGEWIQVGDLKDTRTGVDSPEGFWTMHMHPECQAYEQSPQRPVDSDWYEDSYDPAFEREEAIAYAAGLNPASNHVIMSGCQNTE